MRPVVEGLCKYESLKDGSLDLEDFMRMNDSLNIRDENKLRLQEAADRDRP